MSIPKSLLRYKWKGITEDCVDLIEELISSERKSTNERRVGGTNIGSILKMMGEQIENNSLAAIDENGKAVAAAIVYIPPGERVDTALLEGLVRSSDQGKGIGSFIFNWATERAREELRYRNSVDEIKIRTSCSGAEKGRALFFEEKGLDKVRYSYKMRRDLGDDIMECRVPKGFKLVQWTEGLDGKIINAFNDAFKDQWGIRSMDADSWRGMFTGVDQFRSDLSFALLKDKSVIGFCINWISNNEQGDQVGWIEVIGVVPKYRGKGIASLLMNHALLLFRKQGFNFVELDVDAQNPTGALKLYEKHKFRVIKETVIFEKKL